MDCLVHSNGGVKSISGSISSSLLLVIRSFSLSWMMEDFSSILSLDLDTSNSCSTLESASNLLYFSASSLEIPLADGSSLNLNILTIVSS